MTVEQSIAGSPVFASTFNTIVEPQGFETICSQSSRRAGPEGRSFGISNFTIRKWLRDESHALCH